MSDTTNWKRWNSRLRRLALYSWIVAGVMGLINLGLWLFKAGLLVGLTHR